MADARPSVQRRTWNILKTLVLLVAFWAVHLLVLPISISIVEVDLGIQRFPPKALLATVTLALGTLLSLWAALTLAVTGDGTPLWLDRPRNLVTRGPYGFVRNPMLIAALMQGTGIGVTLGSVPVLVYVTLFGACWYFFVRPSEERGLEKRFGADWTSYAGAVRAWRPRLQSYRPS